MRNGFLLKILFLSLLLPASLRVSGIELPDNVPKQHSFSEAEWKKVTKDIDYSKEAPPPQMKPVKGFNLNLDPGTVKAIVFILVLAILVFILTRVLKGNIFLSDKKLKEQNVFMEVPPEEDIHRSNLEELYAQALAAGNFRLAVRYFYLIVIRELSNKQLILWKREKTNTDYIFDMMNNVFEKPFREVTFLFEKIWYGETELSEQNFILVRSRFDEFISEVKNNLPVKSEASKSSNESRP